jgi:ubiquinone/menaquinone biosynthesis C-methylase UbiE
MAEQYYERYWTSAGYNPTGGVSPSLAKLYARYVPNGADCLDVGCGDGGTSGIWLTEHGARYVGVDVSSKAIDLARDRGLDARLIEDAADLPFSTASFDVVTCIEVFEHLFDPVSAAKEIRRVVKPGGILLASVPNAAHWRDRLDMLIGQWTPRGDDLGRSEPWRSPHIRFFTRASLRQMLVEGGFGPVEVGAKTDWPFFSHLPTPRTRAGSRTPGRAYMRLVEMAPGLIGPTLWAAARVPA